MSESEFVCVSIQCLCLWQAVSVFDNVRVCLCVCVSGCVWVNIYVGMCLCCLLVCVNSLSVSVGMRVSECEFACVSVLVCLYKCVYVSV